METGGASEGNVGPFVAGVCVFGRNGNNTAGGGGGGGGVIAGDGDGNADGGVITGSAVTNFGGLGMPPLDFS